MSNPSTTSDEMASASKQHTHMINLVRGMVPPLTSKLHKGQAGTFASGFKGCILYLIKGRIGVLGGSGE